MSSIAKASAAHVVTLVPADMMRVPSKKKGWFRPAHVLKNPPFTLPFRHSACCFCTMPLVDSVSLTSGDHVPTHWTLAWPIGRSCPVMLAEKGSPENANSSIGVIADTQNVRPPHVGLL